MTTTRITDFEAPEVSLVPRGANRLKFLITKEDGTVTLSQEFTDLITKGQIPNEEKIDEILKAEASLDQKDKDTLKSVMRLLGTLKGKIPEQLMADVAKLAESGYGYPEPTQKECVPPKDEEKKPLMKEAITKEDGSLDLEKIPENLRPAIEAIWKEKADEKAALAKITKELEEKKEDASKKEFIAKAAEFKSLPVKAEEFGLILKDLHAKAPESVKKLEEILKSADTLIAKSGTFTETGTSTAGQGGADAWSKIETGGKVLMQKNEKLTSAQAVDEFLRTEEGKALYREHKTESDKK